jgi:DNA-directed RNA polymerase specialized sigma24 family protein
MKAWIRSRARLKLLYSLGLIKNPDVDKIELPLANFPEAKLQLLSPNQRKVLELRLIKGYSLESAGRELGVTRERIRQKELRALQVLFALLYVRYVRFHAPIHEDPSV